MLRTKHEVDKHVENCLKKINSEAERNQRYFSFARLYFNIGEYEQARRYLSQYLSTKPKSAEAYNLLGKTLEKLGKKDAALEAYRTSLTLDHKQNNLVIKVCELLAADDLELDLSGARYFCEMAQSFDPQNPAVFSLKERLIMTENKNPNEISTLLLRELADRPTDVNLRVRLIKHFLQHNMVREAYKHIFDIENKNISIFHKNINWYEVVTEVLVRYQRDSNLSSSLNWEFWFLSISVLDRFVTLSLDERSDNLKVSSEYIASVFNLDQTLHKASQNIDSCPDRQLSQEFMRHYRGQLCFHIATLIFKQAKKDLIKFKDASNIILPVLFSVYHTQPIDLQALWITHTTEERRNLVQRWHKEAAFRCSQVGHMLISLAKDRKSTLLEKASQYSTGMWREHLFKKIFITRDQQMKINTSYFVTCPQLIEITLRLPESSELLSYDETAQLLHPDSLHHYIWIGLNHKLHEFSLTAFGGLQYSVKNLNNCAAESLSVLDIQAFIYAATLCAQSNLADLKNIIYFNADKPSVLPAAITVQLGTNNQAKFISAAHKLYKKDYSIEFAELRLLLIKGIEVIRCVGHHGLDVKLLVLLANIFAERSKKLSKHSEVEFNDLRAELYWKTALPLLENLKNNQAISYSANRWFEYKSKEMPMNEICGHLEKGKLFIGAQLMKKKEFDKALEIFEALRDPYASFYQAQIYKQMADQLASHNKESVTSEMRSQNIIVLSRARDCLYLTLDRLREPSVDRNHPLNAQLGTEIEHIERLLSRIDPDCINRNECDGMSDENVSSADSTGDHYVTGFLHHNSYLSQTFGHRNDTHNIHSTPLRNDVSRREARPSPERLDAQLRQLAASKDASINHILEQNKLMVDSHRTLVDELRSFKDAVYNLTSTVEELKTMKHGFDELKDIKKSVDELKSSVDDLQSFKTVTDMVYEMKKELAELKKDNIRPNHLTEDDLCILEGEYGADYNIAPHIPPNLYPSYQGRLPGHYGPPLYPGMYSPMAAYAYGGINLPQPAGLQFSPEQQIAAELRAISLGQAPPPVPHPSLVPTNIPPPVLGQSVVPPILPASTVSPGLLSTQPLGAQGNLFSKGLVTTTTSTAQASGFQNFMTSTASPVISTSSQNNKAPPVNVVITSSDPLPSNLTPVPQKPLSVTIPPQHLKGNLPPKQQQPHNYQIPLPSAGFNTMVTPSVLSKPPPQVTTSSLMSQVAPPVYSAVGDKTPMKNVSLGFQIDKSLDQTFSSPKGNFSGSADRSIISSSSVEEHDPCPDFKPIIPLPDEVPLNTGEEDEIALFTERAKLFRYTVTNDVKEWKERGVGILKILQNPKTGKMRILMRRDQVHKICANHFLTSEMKLTPMSNSDRAYIWAAQDFADEQLVTEKLCAKFKTAEEAKKFYDAFEKAKKTLKDGTMTLKPLVENVTPAKSPDTFKVQGTKSATTPSLGGFVFTSTPTFEPKTDKLPAAKVVELEQKSSPFSGFTFTAKTQQQKTNLFGDVKTDFKPFAIETVTAPMKDTPKTETKASTSLNKSTAEEGHDDFVPSAEFKPAVPLPDLVEVKTGEENAEVLFESRAKLLRFDVSGETKEWKERGIGVMKVLRENIIRLVMRREQIHKVCCNHQVFKNMKFQKMANNPKAVTWCAQDFSEGVVKAETFALRFKTPELADEFLKVIVDAQKSMNENSYLMDEKTEAPTSPSNKRTQLNAPGKQPELNTSGTKQQPGFGDKFKPVKGSWGCKICYIVNDGKCNYCVACDSPKNNTIPPKTTSSESSGTSFSFGIANSAPKEGFAPIAKTSGSQPSAAYTLGSGEVTVTKVNKNAKPQAESKPFGFGDAFKPQQGSWECKMCLVRNKSDVVYCVSCETPKDDTIPGKESANKGVNLDTGGQKFTFGIPPGVSSTSSGNSAVSFGKTFTFGQPSTTIAAQFTFGAKTETTTATANVFGNTGSTFSFVKPITATETDVSKDGGSGEKFVFGSPQKHDFGFTPKSPRRVSSGQGDEESDGSYVEEEADNIYFKPVIPLPEKVDVKTGEEQEEVLYCHRAKLFRFVDGEWKERGLGDIKILRNQATGKVRVLMRREQVLKICLNHVLTSDVEYLPKDEKTWLFHAADYSEGEINHQQFCVRFKSADIAQEFKKAVTAALADNSVSSVDNTGKKNERTIEDSDSDIEFISETKVTPEEEKEAIKLGLPPKFMSYRQLPDCTCEQCKKDSAYLGEAYDLSKSKGSLDLTKPPKEGGDQNISTKGNVSSAVSAFGTPTAAGSSPSSGGSIFGTPREQSFGFGSPAVSSTTPHSPSLKELLIKPPTLNVSKPETESKPAGFGTQSGAFSSFTFGASPAKNIFSTPTSIGTASNLFNTKPTFGTPATQSDKSETFSSFSFTGPKSVFASPTITGTATASQSASVFGNTTIFTTSQPAGNLFGGSLTSTTESKSLFGQSPTGGAGNIFGTTASIFNQPADPSKANYVFGKSVFGENKPSAAFGEAKSTIFSGNEATVPSENKPVAFDSKPVAFSENKSIFGNTSIFGQKNDSGSPSTFGSTDASKATSIFGNVLPSTPDKPSAFGVNQGKTSIFGNVTSSQDTPASGGLFGQKPGEGVASFASLASQVDQKQSASAAVKPDSKNISTASLKEGDDLVLKCDTNLSFATLAANTSGSQPTFGKKTGDDANAFAFLGAGAPVFAFHKKKEEHRKSKANESTEGDEGGDTGTAEEEYDPHYEPIVPLPDRIDVSTGEEEETSEFNERAKLYRYDDNTKEWKERGVGQMKILHHPVNNTYRFLLRREQVHKVVLNQLITPDLDMQPMATSEKAWVWAGYNYSEDGSALEKLAIRFKNCDLAKQFYEVFQTVLEAVISIQANKSLPSVVQSYGLEDISGEEEDGVQIHELEIEEEEEDIGDEEDDRSVMCMKRCILCEEGPHGGWQQVTDGDVQIYYDPDLYAARISVNSDTGELVSNTLIGMNTVMELVDKECVWKAVEWAGEQFRWRRLKLTFESESDAQEFHYNFTEGVTYAEHCDIADELPTNSPDENED